jgi:hypothetical protein
MEKRHVGKFARLAMISISAAVGGGAGLSAPGEAEATCYQNGPSCDPGNTDECVAPSAGNYETGANCTDGTCDTPFSFCFGG